ncbi:hypothetical protein [Phyllobacterium sp. K27]
MTPSEPEIQAIDHAEELMALKAYYEARTVGLRGALRREQKKNADLVDMNKQLTERLEVAEKGVEEVREEIAKLTASKPSEADGKAGKAN